MIPPSAHSEEGGSGLDVIRDDRIFRSTRLVAAAVVPILALAFGILYFVPDTTGRNFAWPIVPNMTAMFMGAGYLGGSWLFVNTALGKRWHRVAPGFLPVTAFTACMLLATILHWDRFTHGNLGFQLWLALYVVTPFLIPFLWQRNRVTDPGTPEADDVVVPAAARWSLAALGVVLLAFAVLAYVAPSQVIALWPWQLTPLTARILGGWFALLGVGGLVIGRESRWSAWRVGLQAIGIWHVLVVVASLLSPQDFPGGLLNWYLISVVVVLLSMAGLYVLMERQRRKARPTMPADT